MELNYKWLCGGLTSVLVAGLYLYNDAGKRGFTGLDRGKAADPLHSRIVSRGDPIKPLQFVAVCLDVITMVLSLASMIYVWTNG